jgi:hypothetical protein
LLLMFPRTGNFIKQITQKKKMTRMCMHLHATQWNKSLHGVHLSPLYFQITCCSHKSQIRASCNLRLLKIVIKLRVPLIPFLPVPVASASVASTIPALTPVLPPSTTFTRLHFFVGNIPGILSPSVSVHFFILSHFSRGSPLVFSTSKIFYGCYTGTSNLIDVVIGHKTQVDHLYFALAIFLRPHTSAFIGVLPKGKASY